MGFQSHRSDIEGRLIDELPQVTHNLLNITDLQEKNISSGPPAVPNLVNMSETSNLTRLGFANLMGGVVWYAGVSYSDTVKDAVRTTLREIIVVRDGVGMVKRDTYQTLGRNLLVATRSVIAHTPYPKAFIDTPIHQTRNIGVEEHISKHAESYQELLPFMANSQRKITRKVLKSL